MKISGHWRSMLVSIVAIILAIGIGQSQSLESMTTLEDNGGTNAATAVMDPDVASYNGHFYVTYVKNLTAFVNSSVDGKGFPNKQELPKFDKNGQVIQPRICVWDEPRSSLDVSGGIKTGTGAIAWMELVSGSYSIFVVSLDIAFALSGDAAEYLRFGSPSKVSGDSKVAGISDGEDGHLTIACDLKGQIYVAWVDENGSKLFVRSSPDGSNSFPNPPVQVPNAGNLIRYPQIETDGKALYLAWADGASKSIFFAKSNDGGKTWPVRNTIAKSSNLLDAPAIAIEGGKVVVCYDDVIGAGGGVNIVCATSTDGGEKFESLTKVVSSGDWCDITAGPDKGETAIVYESLAPRGPSLYILGRQGSNPVVLDQGVLSDISFGANSNISRHRVAVAGSLIGVIAAVQTNDKKTKIIFYLIK